MDGRRHGKGEELQHLVGEGRKQIVDCWRMLANREEIRFECVSQDKYY